MLFDVFVNDFYDTRDDGRDERFMVVEDGNLADGGFAVHGTRFTFKYSFP